MTYPFCDYEVVVHLQGDPFEMAVTGPRWLFSRPPVSIHVLATEKSPHLNDDQLDALIDEVEERFKMTVVRSELYPNLFMRIEMRRKDFRPDLPFRLVDLAREVADR